MGNFVITLEDEPAQHLMKKDRRLAAARQVRENGKKAAGR